MALLHRAELRPTKLELLTSWLPTREWWDGADTTTLRLVASYRFDDPAGDVGIETLLVKADDGPVVQVPVTYRAAPLEGTATLLATMEHSVLGRRWVYDGCTDPVYVSVLATVIETGGTHAEQFVDVEGRLERREPTARVQGSGKAASPAARTGRIVGVVDLAATVISTDALRLTVYRYPGAAGDVATESLTGVWADVSSPLLLAAAAPL